MGKEIYERDIRPQVEADHDGEVVAIDVESGSWAIRVTIGLLPWTACGRSARTPMTSGVSG